MDNKCSKPNIPDEVTAYSEKQTMRKKIKEDEIWDELEVGTQIALIRDRNNKHDRKILFRKVCLNASTKKRTSQILTGPDKFVILGDQT